MKFLPLKILAVMAFLFVAPTSLWSTEAPLRVTVSILPQAWFAREIGGPHVEVQVLVGPGHSPATFEPTPRQLADLQRADLFIASGVPFERGLVPRILALPDAPPMIGPEPEPGLAHDTHGHHHHGVDPHTWLDPKQAVQMARDMSAAFTRLKPEAAALFAKRLTAVEKNLAQLDQDIKSELAPYAGRRFFVFHPSFGHFAAAYGLEQVAVEDDGHEPGPRQLARVIDQAKAAGATAIIVQPQFSQKAAATVARSAGLKVIALDPLSDDYEKNLRHITRTLADAFAAESGSKR